MQVDKKLIRNIFLGVAGCILLYWVLNEPEGILSVFSGIYKMIAPFVAGAALAFVLNVPMRAIEKWLKPIQKSGVRRAIAILLTIIAIALVLAGVVWLLFPQLQDTVDSLIAKLPGFFSRVAESVTVFLDNNPELRDILVQYTDFENMDIMGLSQQVISFLSGSLSAVLGSAVSAVVGVYNGVFNGILSVVFCVYCLARKEILARQGRRVLYAFVPERIGDETVRILRMSNATFSSFLSGQCLEAVILGCMFAVCMAIFRMPFMPLVSVIIAVTALVPIVGSFIGCVLGAFLILVQDPMLAVWFVVMFLVLQQIEGSLIYPRVVGSSIGLPGMWVLVAVAVGGDLMGVSGMLLMIPVASVLYALAREITNKRLAAKGIPNVKLQDQPPELRSRFQKKRQTKQERHLLKNRKARAADQKPEQQEGEGEA